MNPNPSLPTPHSSRLSKQVVHLARILSVVLVTGLVGTSQASFWKLQSGISGDNVGLMDQRESATWYSEGTKWGYPQVRLSYHRLSTGELVGIPGGSLNDVGLLGTWVTGIKAVRLTGVAGLDIVQDPTSWRTEFQANWNTGILGGMRASGQVASGGMEGWLARKVRSTSAKAAIGWDGPRTWAEMGAQVEDRSGGVQPKSGLPIQLPYDRVTTAWVWGTRSWTSWLQMGMSANVANSSAETHQPVNIVNDTLQWADVPYSSPHDAIAVSGLLRLSGGPVWISAAWPLWSTCRQRVESTYAWDEAYWYTLENTALAEVKAGGDLVVFKRVALGLEASALSLPYKSNAWFTGDAWNQYGLNLTVRFATP